MRKLIGNGRPGLFKDRRDMPDADVTHQFVMESLIIHGTPEQVTEQIVVLRNQVGPFGTLVYAGHDWADVTLSRRSMELMALMALMARAAMPAVNAAIGKVA